MSLDKGVDAVVRRLGLPLNVTALDICGHLWLPPYCVSGVVLTVNPATKGCLVTVC